MGTCPRGVPCPWGPTSCWQRAATFVPSPIAKADPPVHAPRGCRRRRGPHAPTCAHGPRGGRARLPLLPAHGDGRAGGHAERAAGDRRDRPVAVLRPSAGRSALGPWPAPLLAVASWSWHWPGFVCQLDLNGSLTKAGVASRTRCSGSITCSGPWGGTRPPDVHLPGRRDAGHAGSRCQRRAAVPRPRVALGPERRVARNGGRQRQATDRRRHQPRRPPEPCGGDGAGAAARRRRVGARLPSERTAGSRLRGVPSERHDGSRHAVRPHLRCGQARDGRPASWTWPSVARPTTPSSVADALANPDPSLASGRVGIRRPCGRALA